MRKQWHRLIEVELNLGDGDFETLSVVGKCVKRGCFTDARVLYIPRKCETLAGTKNGRVKQNRFTDA